MRFFLSAGEASGDAYGAALVREMEAHGSSNTFEGVGGAKMRDAGVQIVADSRKWGAIGVTQAVRVYFRVLAGYYKAKRALKQGTPGIFIPIDFGFANLKLSRHAKAAGWKVVYFVPPGSWRKDRQGKDLPALCSAVITPFPWSAEILKDMGVDAHFFGHPLKQLVREQGRAKEKGAKEGIAILPGSRIAEVEQNLPVIAEALKDLPDKATFAVSPNLNLADLQGRWKALAPKRTDAFIVGKTAQVLLNAKAGIVCSGTATLEAALCACPHVVIYRISKITELEARLVRFNVKYISQPNILLDREAVPELIQHSATGPSIREKLENVLNEGEARTLQLKAFAEIDAMLGPDDAITQSAKFLLNFAAKSDEAVKSE